MGKVLIRESGQNIDEMGKILNETIFKKSLYIACNYFMYFIFFCSCMTQGKYT